MQTDFAITELTGHQYTVRIGSVIEVDHIDGDVDSKIESPVLLSSNDSGSDVRVGTPFVEGMKVTSRIVGHLRDDKVRVFKMKSKKRYSRTFGFRADKTRLEILSVA